MTGDSSLPVLGWKERAALPDWHIRRLRVKLDTGAKTSALHVAFMEEIDEHEVEGDRFPVLRMVIPLSRRNPARQVVVETPVVGYKSVRDSGAKSELRPVVRTRLVCGPIDRPIDITVTDRSGMIFRMILGRGALEGAVLVDPARAYTLAPTTLPKGAR